jgi:hypothetical protein
MPFFPLPISYFGSLFTMKHFLEVNNEVVVLSNTSSRTYSSLKL